MDFPVPSNFPKQVRPKKSEEFQPRVDQSRQVLRYRAGQVPEYARAEEDRADSESDTDKQQLKRRRVSRGEAPEEVESSSESSSEDERDIPPQGLKGHRPQRPSRSALDLALDEPPSRQQTQDFAKTGLRKRRRPTDEPVAEVIDESQRPDSPVAEEVTEGLMDVEQDDDEQLDEAARARRQAERRRQRREMESKDRELLQEGGDDKPFGDVQISDGGDEEDSDSDSEVEARRKVLLVKPTFKSKEERVTLEMERLKDEEARVQEEVETLARRKAKREESKQMLEAAVKQAEAEDAKMKHRKEAGLEEEFGSDDEFPDDEISDEDEAYEQWKLRELGRLRRDLMVAEESTKQEEFLDKRRKMTEAERKKDDAKLDAAKPKATQQGQMNYMQKYYHKGAFFQDISRSGQEQAFQKDFNAPVAEDMVDKSLLPAIMRVRRGDWGKRSRSKHTNLRDVDTTDKTAPWAQKHNKVYAKLHQSMGGLKGAYDLDRPSARKQPK